MFRALLSFLLIVIVGQANLHAQCPVTITATGATTFCGSVSGSTYLSITSATTTGWAYQWQCDVTGGTTFANITGATASTYTVSAAGNYRLLTTGTASSCVSNAVLITVNSLPNATITSTGGSACAGATFCVPSAPSTFYQWYLNSSVLAGATSNCYTATAIGSISVTVLSGTTGCTNSNSAASIMSPTATIAPSGTVGICAGSTVSLCATASASAAYQRNKNGLPVVGATTACYTTASAGSYTVTATTGPGCSVTSAATLVVINALPTVTISPSGPATICSSSSASLCASPSTLLSYQWNLNGTPIPGATSSCYSAATAGSYTVSGTNAAGCTGTSSALVVTVNSTPTAPVVTPLSYCQGAIATPLTATGSNLQWYSTSGGLLSVAPTPNTSIIGTVAFFVTQTVGGCTSATTTCPVTVIPLPPTPVAAANTPVCAGDTLFLTAAFSSSSPISFSWIGPNGFSHTLQNVSVPNVTAADSGTYIVRAINGGGCLSVPDSVAVTVTCLDSVWAGDVNYDNTADYLDALEIALNLGATGTARTGASILWNPQHGRDWNNMLNSYSSINQKHADCDGDGIVGYSDTLAVTANYGLTHPKGRHQAMAKATGVPDLYFDLSGIVAVPGTTVSVPIMLGSATLPMQQIAGIAARIRIDGIIATDTPSMSFTGSWLGNSSNTLRFAKGRSYNGVDWVFARTDHHNTSGQGLIGYVSFTLPQGSQGQQLKLYFEDVVMVDSSGKKTIDFNMVDDSVPVTPLGVAGIVPSIGLSILPNPSAGNCMARISLQAVSPYTIEVRDLTGKLVWKDHKVGRQGSQQAALPVDGIGVGVYIVSIHAANWPGIMQVKWVKLN